MKYFNIENFTVGIEDGVVIIKILFKKKLFADVVLFHIGVEFFMTAMELSMEGIDTHTMFASADCSSIIGTIYIGGRLCNGSDSKQEEVSN